jgi:hypothetical protein
MPQVLTSWSRLYQLLHGMLPMLPQVVPAGRGGAVGGTGRGRRAPAHQRRRVRGRAADRRRRHPLRDPPAVLARGAAAVRRLRRLARPVRRSGAVARRPRSDVRSFGFCLPPGEQMLGYPVAGPGNSTRAGNAPGTSSGTAPRRRPTAGATAHRCRRRAPPARHPAEQGVVAQRGRDARRRRRLLAPAFAEIVEKCAQPFLQPIHDLVRAIVQRPRGA